MKNFSMSIGGIVFYIEKDGFEVLNKYLENLKSDVSAYNDQSRILTYIEDKIAEVFLFKLENGIQIITVEDVEEMIASKEGPRGFDVLKKTSHVYLF